MKERPILMSAPMVRAILNGRKTQTRRIVKPQPVECAQTVAYFRGREWHAKMPDPEIAGLNLHLGEHLCPYGQPGDRLYVKEHAWMWCEKIPNGTTKKGRTKFKYVPLRCARVFYCADHPERPAIDVVCEYRGYPWGWRKKLGRFLPHWASRITLEVAAVRVERLNDIDGVDAMAEGIETLSGLPAVNAVTDYQVLWESINGSGSWAANPWVWVIEFRRVQP